MRNTFHPLFQSPRRIILLLILAALAATNANAQNNDRDTRAAQWDAYKLPEGEFVRFIDKQNGLSFWHPAEWKERQSSDGNRFFQPAPQGVNLFVMTEEIPDGYGVANYTSGVLQGLRKQPVQQDTVVVRRVMAGGLEWREISYNIEARNGVVAHQTMWFTALGPRAYGFVLTAAQDEIEKHQPVLKRIILSARVGAAGHWDEEFENLRARLASGAQLPPGRDVVAATIAEDLRTARQSLDAGVARLSELFGQVPDAAFDLMTDADPQVRTAAILALEKSRSNVLTADLTNDALVWALSDPDVFASAAAARALAARGAAGLAAFKSKLQVARAVRPEAIVRAGIAFGAQASTELIARMLRGDSTNEHLGALQLALALPQLDTPLPYSKLLSSSNLGVIYATAAVLQRHAGSRALADAPSELIKMLRGDSEIWAARALGEIAPATLAAGLTADALAADALAADALAAELDKRIAEIDARLAALGKASNSQQPASSKRTAAGKSDKQDNQDDSAELSSLLIASQFNAKPEDVRLAMTRGQLDVAARKIRFRDRWNSAKDEAARRAVIAEINKTHGDLAEWAKSALTAAADPTSPAPPTFDATRLTRAPTTGETLFPKNTISYVMAPNFAATMDKLDAALSGVQMATVRDQMTFALILKMLKTTLADKTGASRTGDAATATGIDLKSPMALATWAGGGKSKDSDFRSAVILRVTDRTRFERLVATYQEQLGDLNSFAVVTAALVRFAGLLPAALPVIAAAVASDEARDDLAKNVPKNVYGSSASKPAAPSLKPFAWTRRENLNGLPVTILEKPTITQSGGVEWQTIYLAYLDGTAVLASSEGAMVDVIATAMQQRQSIAQSEAFARSRRAQSETGEIVFFSDLPALLESAFDSVGTGGEEFLKPILKAFGAESGSLRISQTSWETGFNIGLAENEFTGSFKPFRADSLAAPRDLLPLATILYAGAVIDPAKMLGLVKKLDSATPAGPAPSASRSKEIDDAIEKHIVPQMHGEIAAAVVSFKPIFDNGEWPAAVFAARLKSGALADAMRTGKLFPNFKRLPDVTALGSAVVALGENQTAPFAAVTGAYFLLADSVETLKLMESKEKFSSSRDFTRSIENLPNGADNLALFATYNLESAFDEASKVLAGGESQRMLPFVSALVHAFHSQRAFVTLGRDGQAQFLTGHLSVSFDREGRYSVGDLTRRSADFDVANATITPKGLSVLQSTRVEAMTLRVAAKLPGVAPRVREDLAKFPWQRIETSNDSSVVVSIAARRIPENLTVLLPVTAPEFAPYLNPTAQINSKAPQIVALGKQIAGEDKDGRSVARKIGDWTYQNLKWKKVESDAVDTLASREADCLEHSELYVALARSLGLPARVVTGAALSGGSFGAHAWVEVYLGKWVELDPTWGLMDHVDATHLRFDGDAFTSYAMLNQLELEIVAARRTVAAYQRDPVRLVKEFSLDAATRDLAFDLSLTVEQTLGVDRWGKLDEKQRAAVIKAFERTVNGMWEVWSEEFAEPVRVIRNETSGGGAVLTILRGEALLRLTLAERDGAWFITEHEILDDALAEFADALAGALQPEKWRGRVFEISPDAALKHIEQMVAAGGEKPELLLLKARILDLLHFHQENAELFQPGNEKKDKPVDQQPAQPPAQQPAAAEPRVDVSLELLKQVAVRWPDFAQAHLALGRELLETQDDGALSPLSKNAAAGVAALLRYAELMPDDPRVWREIAQAYEQMEKDAEAERAYRKAIELDRGYLDHQAALVNFLLDRGELDKSKAVFAEMLKTASAAGETDEAFEYLDDGEGFDPDSARVREELLKAFPKEVAASQPALRLLADLQETQNKLAEAVKTIQRAIAIEAAAEDYGTLSSLYRQQRRFNEALAAANQALKLDDSATYVQFERACSLAQLGRKREAIAALKQMVEAEPPLFFDDTEPDLQPLATMPEFKAIKEKMKEAATPEDQKVEGKTEKPKKP